MNHSPSPAPPRPVRRRWRTLLAVAATVALSSTAGAAWAQTQQSSADGDSLPAGARALGGSRPEAVFTPIVPCRIIDTRFAAAGKMAANATRTFKVRGTDNFPVQGGKNGGCGIPVGAVAIEVTITAVDAGNGYLRAAPGGGGIPAATFLNMSTAIDLSNTGTIDICETCPTGNDLQIKVFNASSHVVADVQGYYQQVPTAAVTASGTLIAGSRTVSVTRISTGQYRVMFDRNVSSCAYQATVGGVAGVISTGFASTTLSNTSNAGVTVLTYNNAGDLTDRDFTVQVTC